MTQPPAREELAQQCAEFLQRSRPDVFERWPKGTLFRWLHYHIDQRAVAVVARGGRIEAVGIGWRSQMPDITDRWAVWNDQGDCFYFDQLHAETPEALAQLLRLFADRVPAWKSLHLFADRHGRRTRLHPELLQRLSAFAQSKS